MQTFLENQQCPVTRKEFFQSFWNLHHKSKDYAGARTPGQSGRGPRATVTTLSALIHYNHTVYVPLIRNRQMQMLKFIVFHPRKVFLMKGTFLHCCNVIGVYHCCAISLYSLAIFSSLSSATVESSGRTRIHWVYFFISKWTKKQMSNPSFRRSDTDPRSVQSAGRPMHKQSRVHWTFEVLPGASADRESYLENQGSQTNTVASYTARALSPFLKSRRTSSHNWQSAHKVLLNIQDISAFMT